MQLPKWVVVGDRVTAVEAAKRYGLYVKALTSAIDAGLVPSAERIVTGTRCIRLVDLVGLGEQLAGLPRCAHVFKSGVACDRPVTLSPGSVACSGPHARAIETRGKAWRSPEAIEKSNAAKRGVARPDVRERVLAMHADSLLRNEWHYKLVVGRGLPPKSQRDRKLALVGVQNARAGKLGRSPVELDDAVAAEVRRLSEKGFGRDAIAGILGISARQVRNIRAS